MRFTEKGVTQRVAMTALTVPVSCATGSDGSGIAPGDCSLRSHADSTIILIDSKNNDLESGIVASL